MGGLPDCISSLVVFLRLSSYMLGTAFGHFFPLFCRVFCRSQYRCRGQYRTSEPASVSCGSLFHRERSIPIRHACFNAASSGCVVAKGSTPLRVRSFCEIFVT